MQSRTVRRPEDADAAVLRLPHGGRRRSPSRSTAPAAASPATRTAGTVEAVLECAANLACVGAEPLGLTNCLNFGNPEKPHIAWQLSESVRGMGDACRALDVPVVGGNVSLYNEGADGPIYPTPVVGMVGELPDAARAGRLGFAREGDAIAFVGPFAPVAAGVRAGEAARRAAARRRCPRSTSPRCARRRRRSATRSAAASCAQRARRRRGRLAVALAECCLAGGLGAVLELGADGDALTRLFGEGAGGFVVSGPRGRAARASATASRSR